MSGMRPDDVAIIADADETYTRDFLRALQICDIPELRPGQNCRTPKLIGSTLILESSPECITISKRWHHPDAVLGECVHLIGNSAMHPIPKRQYSTKIKDGWKTIESYHGSRLKGYGNNRDYSMFKDGEYPLWFANDIRAEAGGRMISKGIYPSGYHFHNFFTSAREIEFKYLTYGHPEPDATKKPFWE